MPRLPRWGGSPLPCFPLPCFPLPPHALRTSPHPFSFPPSAFLQSSIRSRPNFGAPRPVPSSPRRSLLPAQIPFPAVQPTFRCGLRIPAHRISSRLDCPTPPPCPGFPPAAPHRPWLRVSLAPRPSARRSSTFRPTGRSSCRAGGSVSSVEDGSSSAGLPHLRLHSTRSETLNGSQRMTTIGPSFARLAQGWTPALRSNLG